MAGTTKRGLASADEKTRREVARKGGQASHGGGRHPSGQKGGQSSTQSQQGNKQDSMMENWAQDYEEMDDEEEGVGGSTL